MEQTEHLLAGPGPVTLFEAAFEADGVLIRADILVRNAAGQLRLIEVKAATEVKNYHVLDCAIQLRVLQQHGLNVVRVDLAHINKSFVYPGGGDYAGLLTYANVTAKARGLQNKVQQLIAGLRTTLDAGEPQVLMGAQCKQPFECSFIEHCYRDDYGPPTDWPIRWLPGGRTLHRKLEAAGFRDIRDIPEGYLTNGAAERCRRVTVAGAAELDPAAAGQLAALGWPRYYLDFETLAPAVPAFAGTRPYTMQAFQWSCHIEYEDGSLEHREFLPARAAPSEDAAVSTTIQSSTGSETSPERACAEALLQALGDTGPVYMYTGYERSVLKSLSDQFPDLAKPLAALTKRLYDLHPLTRDYYCHPDLHGSWSIKSVLPTVAPDLSYAGLEIVSVGTDAADAFLEMLNEQTTAERAAELRAALLRYCKLDTEAMVRLARFLEWR